MDLYYYRLWVRTRIRRIFCELLIVRELLVDREIYILLLVPGKLTAIVLTAHFEIPPFQFNNCSE